MNHTGSGTVSQKKHCFTCMILYDQICNASKIIYSFQGRQKRSHQEHACLCHPLPLLMKCFTTIPKKSTQTYGISKGINCLNPLVQTKQPRHRQEALNGVVTRLGVRSICADVRSAAVAASAAAAAAAVVAAPDASAPGSVEVKGQWWFHTPLQLWK